MDSSAIQFGMMNSMRTSNVILDTLICLLIPIMFKCFFDSSEQLTVAFAYVRDCFRRKGNEVVRRIELKTHFNTWGKVQDTEEHNHILQKAISIYLSDHLVMAKKSGRYELLDKVDSPETDATELAEPEPEDDPYGLNESLELQKLKIGALPPLNEWITIEPELEFYHEISSNDGHNGGGGENNALKESTITFILRSTAVDATDRIDAFVNRAFESYQAAVVAKHKKDKARYMYMTAATAGSSGAGDGGGGGDAGASVAKYKRYGLSEDKTFDSLFFDDKPKLLTLLDNFQTKRGKFGIRGFPYKMGLLLHGPPGTGKTSLIKAVAQHTNRHIVNISLSKIKTNQELMDMMFDLKFGLDGEDLPVKLRFDQIVFVMEDVDCASNVVLARTDATSLSQHDTTSITRGGTATTSPPPHVLCNGDDNDMIGIGECGFEGGGSPRHRRQPRDEEGGEELDPLVDMVMGPKNYNNNSTNRLSSWGPKDKLNLSGLLNVLDGVVDSPGRILILTTNHPEKLDPALIRPGRVNKQVQLGPINGRQTMAMMEHYFACTLSPNQSAVVDRVFERATNSGISPAQIEQLCAEHDDVDDMLEELATLFTA
ncbi:hypothetical protein H257_11614 [Aphanomyces astaci]|uniref:AAA+ ATPase domain-containing protein n=1 Tax=Aphanomyces astaci TaxID=112090 RepID=W4G2I1_APHAT|nr:hypothetical protein H257_11614 [Aphanomyces astaci]ETV73486.1 hypothetical protein H257_11614 [Aphanomyces astaci]|eukprot:XP_009836912.1 hypothetical protein H257_11614 [Aphanomyces astaci]